MTLHKAHDSLISCAEAKRIGQTWYFTGRPCVRGHVDKRSAANGNCRSCDSEKAKARCSRKVGRWSLANLHCGM